jgi:hypothetical protein
MPVDERFSFSNEGVQLRDLFWFSLWTVCLELKLKIGPGTFHRVSS